MQVVVIGAGLSGLAAALRLVERGHFVTLLEKRPFPGGRAYSFRDPDGEGELDNGQHVILGCCTEYIDFVNQVGSGDLLRLQECVEVPFIRASDRKVFWLRSSWLPAPFHLLPSILRFGPLSFAERRRVLKAAAMMRVLEGADEQTFSDWLSEHGQSDPVIRTFWDVAILAILNERSDRVSAAQALFVFKEGFFSSRRAACLGYVRGGLGEIARRALSAFERKGGQVQMNRKVTRIGERRIELSDGTSLAADVIISAVPAKALLEMLPVPCPPFFAPAARIETSPIVNLHVTFDRPVWDLEFACFLESRLQWVFNRTRMQGGPAGSGTQLTVSLSGARDVMAMPEEQVRTVFTDELRRVFDGDVVRMRIVREAHATFVAGPGAHACRLPARTPLPYLVLAGEWTDTGWPSTMEGAVRSGRTAADLIAAGRSQ